MKNMLFAFSFLESLSTVVQKVRIIGKVLNTDQNQVEEI